MRFAVLLWMLFPLLATSVTGSARARPELSAQPTLDARLASHDMQVVRPAGGTAIHVVGRDESRGFGGPGSAREAIPAQRIHSPCAVYAPLRLAELQVSHAVSAHGGPLLHFPTAPPSHG